MHAATEVKAEIFEMEQVDDTLIVVPTVDLRELDSQWIDEGAREILELLNGSGVRNVVLDFHNTDYYGSTALGFFLKLWKRVRTQQGRMAFCNVSEHEKEILQERDSPGHESGPPVADLLIKGRGVEGN